MAEAKIVIKGKDNTKKAFGSIKKGSESVGKSISKLKAGFVAFGAALGGALVLGSIKKVVTAANEQERAITQLSQSLKTAGDFSDEAVQSFKDLASAQQKVTTFGDEVTLSAAAQLKQFSGLSNELVRKLIPSIQDFSAGMGIDLKTAAQLVGKTLGSTTNALSRYGIELTEVNDKTARTEELLIQLSGRFGGQAKAQAEDFGGALTQVGNAFGDVLEGVGFLITRSPELNNVLTILTASFSKLTDLLPKAKNETEILEAELKKEEETLEKLNKRMEAGNLNLQNLLGSTKQEIDLRKISIQTLKFKIEEIEKENIASVKAAELQKQKAILQERENSLQQKSLDQNVINIAAKENEILIIGNVITAKNSEIEKTKEALAVAKQAEKEQQSAIIRTIALQQAKINIIGEVAGNILSAGASIQSFQKKNATIDKRIAQSQAIIQGALGVNRALGSTTPPLNFILAASVGIAAAAQVAAIEKQSFQTPQGASRIVPGPSNQEVPIIAHGGETVGRGGGEGGLTINVMGNIFNSEETLDQISTGLIDFQRRTGVSFAG